MQAKIAAALLDIKAVGFSPQQPITFKSGLVSPVYVDNRIFPAHPQEWELVIAGFQQLIAQQRLEFDLLAGIETAGIPHSAALGYQLRQPSVFIRKKVKDHGTKSKIEGGQVQGKKVLLIEDHVTTGGSSLAGVEALRHDQGEVADCLAITAYGFPEAEKAFAQANVKLHTLTTFPIILEVALARKLFSPAEKELIESWLQEPWSWAERNK